MNTTTESKNVTFPIIIDWLYDSIPTIIIVLLSIVNPSDKFHDNKFHYATHFHHTKSTIFVQQSREKILIVKKKSTSLCIHIGIQHIVAG